MAECEICGKKFANCRQLGPHLRSCKKTLVKNLDQDTPLFSSSDSEPCYTITEPYMPARQRTQSLLHELARRLPSVQWGVRKPPRNQARDVNPRTNISCARDLRTVGHCILALLYVRPYVLSTTFTCEHIYVHALTYMLTSQHICVSYIYTFML